MFEKLRNTFSRFLEGFRRALSLGGNVDELIDEFKMNLLSCDVAFDVVEEMSEKLRGLTKEGVVRDGASLLRSLEDMIRSYFPDPTPIIKAFTEKPRKRPLVVLFFGVNGVGKTTTIAKLAVFSSKHGLRALMVAADTFRAGAQEQLKIHAERAGIPIFMGRYGVSPASIVYDAIEYARNRGYDILLVDTAGRMHTDEDLINELKKIVRVSNPDLKLLVVDALTGNDAVVQAKFFEERVGVDAVVVTKVDAYEGGGVPLSVAYAIRKPVAFVGVGQGYEDLKPFDVNEFVSKILRPERA